MSYFEDFLHLTFCAPLILIHLPCPPRLTLVQDSSVRAGRREESDKSPYYWILSPATSLIIISGLGDQGVAWAARSDVG